MFFRPSCLLLLSPLLFTAYATAEEPLFPFVVSYDSPANVTNVADLLERPAGKRGFVHAENGRLVVGAAGATKPIRFWATNICFEACFPCPRTGRTPGRPAGPAGHQLRAAAPHGQPLDLGR